MPTSSEPATAIRVRGISKRYRVSTRQAPYGSLRDSLADWARAPLQLLGGNRRPARRAFWALQDVSFDVQAGEAVGIIGRNGAGKSTLLKVLSRITEPTAGRAEIHGRVGTLLEVGTGFHPELTGRENIFLNGAILGMRRLDIARQLDEIIAFAEIEDFVETPVKYYSSGMYVRLAFAVAAHLEPEILMVDEVLAVGDLAFQRKCLGKMEDVARHGRTVLFVSHNMSALAKLVGSALLLDAGRVVMRGPARQVIDEYLRRNFPQAGTVEYPDEPAKQAQITRLSVVGSGGKASSTLSVSDPIAIDAEFVVRKSPRQMHVAFLIELPDGSTLLDSATSDDAAMPITWDPGCHCVRMTFPGALLRAGRYLVRVGIGRTDGSVLDAHISDGLSFDLTESTEGGRASKGRGLLTLLPRYETRSLGPA